MNLHICVKILLYWYIFIFFSTEILSYFHILERKYILPGELFFWIIILFFLRKEILYSLKSINLKSKSILIILVLSVLILIQGLFSAPNSTDSMVYHLPRVMYWVQEKTLFQDSVRNVHDYMPPFGHYILLHLYFIFGNDNFLFLSQWISYVISIIISGLIAKSLGANRQVSNFVILLVAALPIAVMQASSTKVELLVTEFVVICTYIVLRLRKKNIWDYIALAFGLSLGILIKQTFILYAVIPLGILLIKLFFNKKIYFFFLFLFFIIFIIIQARFISQNLLIYNSISGSESNYSGLTNQSISLKGISSNLIKNTMLHIPIPIFTKQIEDLLISVHKLLRIDINDCMTTFCDPDFRFRITKAIYPQEDIASNSFHLLLIVVTGIILLSQLIKKKLNFYEFYIYSLTILSYIAFSAFLKWQPFHSRLHMPFFVIGTIISVVILSKFKKGLYFIKSILILSIFLALSLIFLNVIRPYISYNLFYNDIKSFATPLMGIPESFFTKPYEQQYFNPRTYWYKPYKGIMEIVRKQPLTATDTIVLRLMDDFEYPFWMFVKKYNLNLRIVPESKVSNETIIISTSRDFYSINGYITQCIKTDIEYGYACLSIKNGII